MPNDNSFPPPQPSMPERRSSSPNATQQGLNDRIILERISTLLSHYWTAAEPPELRQLQLRDWLEDLGEFAARDVATAIKDYRQGPNGNRRPVPHDIRVLTVAAERGRKPAPTTPAIEKPEWMRRAPPEEKPADDVIRPHWVKIPFAELTAAEQQLCRQRNRQMVEETLTGEMKRRVLAMMGLVT